MRIHVVGKGTLPSYPNESYSFTGDIAEADLVVLTRQPGRELRKPTRFWPAAVPVVSFRVPWPYADWKAPAFDAAVMERAIAGAADIGARYRRIPESVRRGLFDDPYLSALAFVYMRGGDKALLDRRLPRGYGWRGVRLGEAFERIAADLREADYLNFDFADSAHLCPNCGGVLVIMRDACPVCHSTNLADSVLVHHFRCGYQAAESAFVTDNGDYVCPKCREELRHIGLDYDKPGTVSSCRSCGEEAFETTVAGRCLTCQTKFVPSASSRRSFYDMRATTRGMEALFTGQLEHHDPEHILSGHLMLVPMDTLLAVASKLNYLGERLKFQSSVLTIHIDGEQDITTRTELARRVGEELSHMLRAEDAVSYHLGELVVLLAAGNKVAEARRRLVNALSEVFEASVVERLRIDSEPLDSYIDRVRN